jgi:hypothetical protein
MQILHRPQIDDSIIVLLAIAQLLAVVLLSVSAAKNVYDAEAHEIEHALRSFRAGL